MRALLLSLLVVGAAVTAGCTSASHQRAVLVHVRAIPFGSSSHQTVGVLVTAADAHWNLVTAKGGQAGSATLRLTPGRYVLTSSHSDCHPERIKLQAGETSRTVVLSCGARR